MTGEQAHSCHRKAVSLNGTNIANQIDNTNLRLSGGKVGFTIHLTFLTQLGVSTILCLRSLKRWSV